MRDRKRPDRYHQRLHWWHLAALLLLVVAVLGGGAAIAGASPLQALLQLPRPLYNWCPILAGVAIAIRRADAASARAAIGVGLTMMALMVVLDGARDLTPQQPVQGTAISTRGLTSMGSDDTGTGWVRTAVDWLERDLEGIEGRLAPGQIYPVDHPRRRAGEALLDGSLLLLVFGVLGVVLAAGRWIRSHVTFRRREDERAAHLVVAWLMSPMAVGLALRSAEKFRFRALFQDGPLWAILLPPLAMLGLGIAAWLWSAKDPPSDDSSSPSEHELADRTRDE